MENILEITNVTKWYGKQEALKNVSLTVPSGCITGLLGPNGSGKTTLIKIIMGLISDYSGTVKITGLKPGPEALNRISYLPDKSFVPEWLTCAEAVKMFEGFYSDFDTKRVADMLDSMNIPVKTRIKSLSKGMREKLQLALVMSRRAAVYVLDEPIAAVDPAARDFIMRTILGNCAEGSSIFLSSHIISDIEPSLDRVLFLREGGIIINEDAEELRNSRQMSIDGLFREVFKC